MREPDPQSDVWVSVTELPRVQVGDEICAAQVAYLDAAKWATAAGRRPPR